jgi:hypothetical protein
VRLPRQAGVALEVIDAATGADIRPLLLDDKS